VVQLKNGTLLTVELGIDSRYEQEECGDDKLPQEMHGDFKLV